MVAKAGPCALAAMLLILAASAVFAQDAGAAAPRRVLLLVTQSAGAGWDNDAFSLVSRSLFLGVQSDDGVRAAGTIIVEPPSGSVPASDDARARAARAVGADGWLWIELPQAPGGASLRVHSFDLASGAQDIDEAVPVRNGLSPLELPAADWSKVAHLVVRAFSPTAAGKALAAARTSARLSIHARPGSVVKIAGGTAVTIDADGGTSVTLDAPGEYALRATLPGFSPSTQTLFLTSDREVTFSQAPAVRWALEGSLSDAAWPGVGLSWFAVPDSLSLGIGFSTYLFGLALNEQNVFASQPLTNVHLWYAFYMAPADSFFRAYSGFVVFVRIIHAPVYFGLDPLSPVGAQFVLGAEIDRTLRGGFFLEYVPTVYFTNLPTLFQASLGTDSRIPGWLFGPGFAQNLLTFRMGYRWML